MYDYCSEHPDSSINRYTYMAVAWLLNKCAQSLCEQFQVGPESVRPATVVEKLAASFWCAEQALTRHFGLHCHKTAVPEPDIAQLTRVARAVLTTRAQP